MGNHDPGDFSRKAACTQRVRFNEASSTGEVSIGQGASASVTTPERGRDAKNPGGRGTDSVPGGGGEGGENGCPPLHRSGHSHPPLFPLPNPSPAPPLCKSGDSTDLHNSCIISTCYCQAFRLYKAILLSLMGSKSQGERFFCAFLVKHRNSLQILSWREGQ